MLKIIKEYIIRLKVQKELEKYEKWMEQQEHLKLRFFEKEIIRNYLLTKYGSQPRGIKKLSLTRKGKKAVKKAKYYRYGTTAGPIVMDELVEYKFTGVRANIPDVDKKDFEEGKTDIEQLHTFSESSVTVSEVVDASED